jgi:hypothetical protein
MLDDWFLVSQITLNWIMFGLIIWRIRDLEKVMRR